ncbi:MAG TPA: ABC transporter permease [Longimicrobiales bacterium]|nr:ABC transporter permease [Longimicrobiales bacterium]
MKRLEWFIARRYLASRRKGRFLSLITLIAVGGIFLGVMALITVIAVMTGLQRDLQAKIIGSNPHIYVFDSRGQGFHMDNWRAVLDSIDQIPSVVTAQPFMMTKVGVLANKTATSGMLYGIQPTSDRPPLSDIERRIRAGDLRLGPTRSGKPGLLVGSRLATQISAVHGDILQIASLENIKTGPTGDLVPVIVEFELTGVFETGMYEYDSEFMYAYLAPVQDLLSFDSTAVSGIAVNVADPWKVQQTKARIDAKLGFAYYTSDWIDLNSALFSALKLEKLAMAVILSLIVLVAAFNIISTLIMVVADKTREIGILKSMGMTDRGVLRIFVMQGITIGVIGTVLGAIAGVVLVWIVDRYELIKLSGEVYFIDRLPVDLDPLDVGLIVCLSLLIAFTATIYPARQASRLLPVEAIRHE